MATAISLPPAAELESAARALITNADPKKAGAYSRALYDLITGAEIIAVCGGFLMPSASRPGMVHRVDSETDTCSCEARGFCRHLAAIQIVEQAQRFTMPVLSAKIANARSAAYERALAEINELF